jgi:sensor domain CHASE-containing protein
MVIGIAAWVVSSMFVSIEEQIGEDNAFRVSQLLQTNLEALTVTTTDYGVWYATAAAVESVRLSGNMSMFDAYVRQNFFDGDGNFNTYLGMNLVAIFNASGAAYFIQYNPPNGATEEDVSAVASAPPTELLDPAFLQGMPDADYHGIINFEGMPAMIASFQSIRYNEDDPNVVGTLLMAYHFANGLGAIADVVQACITAWMPQNASLLDDEYHAFESLLDDAQNNWSEWGSPKYIVSMADVLFADQDGRVCPEGSDETVNKHLEAAFFLLRDPIPGHAIGPLVRVDHRRNFLLSSTTSLFILLVVIVVSLFALAGLFTLFLDKTVLRRLNKLNSFLTDTVVGGIDSSSSSSSVAMPKASRGDEIRRLGRMLRYKLNLVTAELAATAGSLSEQRIANDHTLAALHLLNLLCGREGAPPEELLPQLSPQPSIVVSLEGIMDNPLALEFLKAYCRDESSPENILYILDVEQLRSLAAQF